MQKVEGFHQVVAAAVSVRVFKGSEACQGRVWVAMSPENTYVHGLPWVRPTRTSESADRQGRGKASRRASCPASLLWEKRQCRGCRLPLEGSRRIKRDCSNQARTIHEQRDLQDRFGDKNRCIGWGGQPSDAIRSRSQRRAAALCTHGKRQPSGSL